jgi:hypothetical protein
VLDLHCFGGGSHPIAVAEYNKPDIAIPPKNIDIALVFFS